MPTRGKGDTKFLPLFGGLCLVLGFVLGLAGGTDHALTARFVAEAKPAVAEVVSSHDHRSRHSNGLCCITTVVVVDEDGSRLTGSWRDPVRYIPGGAVDVLHRRGPSFRPVRMVPDDDRAVWKWSRLGLKVGGTFVAMGAASLLLGSLLWRRAAGPAYPSRAPPPLG